MCHFSSVGLAKDDNYVIYQLAFEEFSLTASYSQANKLELNDYENRLSRLSAHISLSRCNGDAWRPPPLKAVASHGTQTGRQPSRHKAKHAWE